MKTPTWCGAMILCAASSALAAEKVKPTLKKLPVGTETVTIYRDEYGVPRIFAATRHGLFVGNGYAVAEDRGWQMEKYRLDAEGRLAEAFGEKFLDHDKEVRRDGMTMEEWRNEFDRLPFDIQEIFRAYAEGVNMFLDEAGKAGKLPEGFTKSDWKPTPWTVEDSMAIGGMMGRRFGASGTDQLRNLAILDFLAKRLGSHDAALKVFDDIGYVDDPAAIPTVPSTAPAKGRAKPVSPSGTGARASRNRLLPPREDPAFLARLQAEVNVPEVYEAARVLGLATRWGSYCWALAPSHSASGHAVLVGGPQMGFATPQIAHEIQLTGAGFNVMGMGFAGIAGVLIGSNDHLAWTSTSGESHNEDVFVEKLKSDDPHQYLHRGAYREMEHRLEHILVRGKPTVDYDVYRSIHGPIIEWSPARNVAYSKQMAYFGKEWETSVAFIGLNTAKSIKDIPALAAQIASNHNIFVATQDGDIGFWHGGFFPAYAAGVDPRLPLRGTGEDDWEGFLTFDKLPQVTNPKTGIIFNWNNKPAASWTNASVPAWGVAHHISNIRNVLDRRLKEHGGKLSFTEVEAVAPEIGRLNYIAGWLKPGLFDALSRAGAKLSPEAKQAAEYLRAWDDRAVDGSVAQTIFDTWYKRLQQDIFSPTVGDLGSKENFNEFVNSSAVFHALAGHASTVPLSRDYLGGKTPDQVRLQALVEALAELAKERGAEMSRWQYRTEWISFDPLPAIPWYSRGTYIQIVELARPAVQGAWILPPGQSEDPHSPHFSDQLSLAGWWMFAPMQLMTDGEATKSAKTE